MASYKSRLQEYTQKLHLAMPVYESVNEGFDHLPSFKCFVTVNGLRYGCCGAHKHKKDAEQSAAQVAIQDLATEHPDYQFEMKQEAIGKKQLTDLLVNMGIVGSPTFSSTMMGVVHSPDFTTTVQIGGLSYVGGVAKSKREAERKAAFVAFQAIKEQGSDPHFQLQLQAESRASHELKQPTKECKDIKPELRAITNSCPPCNKFLAGNNPKQTENSCEMLIMENAYAVEKGPGNLNANDENSAPSIELHNQLERENFLIVPKQKETEAQNIITNRCPPCNKFLVRNNPKQIENSCEMSIMENVCAVEKGPGNLNANDENSAPLIEPDNQLEQENFLIVPKQEETEAQKQGVEKANLKDSISKRSRSDHENCEEISGQIKKEKK